MKRFDGKTAWWLYLLLLLYNLTPIAILVFDKSFEWSAATIICFVLCYLFNLVWLPIMIIDWVDVYDDYFVFRYGFLKIKVNIEDIVEIKKTHTPISATANSFDRVYVKTEKKGFCLALYKNDAFIELVSSKMKKQTVK
ncbi:MAG: PH domain-containing protein [Clostridia bacterium]|nr:PH domain-containing protein [Clostridia bacterium]